MAEAVVRCASCGARTVLDARRLCSFCGCAQPDPRAKLTPQEIATYYDVHKRGRSVWEIAKAIWKPAGYASAGSALSSLRGHFEREEIRRGLRPPKPAKRRGCPRRLSDAQVTEAHRRYVEEGISAHALSKELWREAGYSSPASCETALGKAFREAGYEVRERIEATRLASTKHGMAPKHGPRPGYGSYKRKVLRGEEDRPVCKGKKTTAPRKGEPCERKAAAGSEYCPGHDPEKQKKRRAHLARLHEATRQRAAAEALPIDPFVEFLRRCIAEEGTQKAAAERLGLGITSISAYARGLGSDKRPKRTIQRSTVERVLKRDGCDIAELYQS